MQKKMVILTRSSKFGQYCVAGIDCENGEWIRLVSENEATHGALSLADLQYDNRDYANVLDVINVTVKRKDNNPIQPENYVIDNGYYLGYEGSISIDEACNMLSKYTPNYILGDNSYYIDEDEISSIGKSLCLAMVSNVSISQQVNDEGKPKTKISFLYRGHLYSNLSVTDPNFYAVANGTSFDGAVVVVSLGTPYNGKYYKFVSAIYPV